MTPSTLGDRPCAGYGVSLIPALLREVEPLGDVGIDEGRKALGRGRRGLGALLGEPLAGIGQRQHGPGVGADLVDDLARRTRRREQAEPAERLNSPARPLSATVGKSGNSAERVDPVVPITRSVPAAMCGVTVDAGENITSMRPPRRSVTAGPVPR